MKRIQFVKFIRTSFTLKIYFFDSLIYKIVNINRIISDQSGKETDSHVMRKCQESIDSRFIYLLVFK